MDKQFELYNNIPQEKFAIVKNFSRSDKKIETKQVGYLQDAFRRFTKNKASVIASFIIIILILFALLGPVVSSFNPEFNDLKVSYRLPKSKAFSWLGWDGCKKVEINEIDYYRYLATERETGNDIIHDVYDSRSNTVSMGAINFTSYYYTVRLDTYTYKTMQWAQLTKEEYLAIQAYQDEHNIQIIYPVTPDNLVPEIYYKVHDKGNDKELPYGIRSVENFEDYEFELLYYPYDGKDDYSSKMRIEGDELTYKYALKKQGGSYLVRLDYNRYFEFLYGCEPVFLFGTDQYGRDIFIRLSSGARFSFIFAICISIINLTIGAIYGSIEGYFGGTTDLVMERISDILSGVPFMVVVTLFKLHVAAKVGTVVTLLFAFVMTGWLGMAGTTRMQFYRYKNQEYVLAARTLGASNRRIMFKHIFPNALGTLVTSSVLVIPGVIFSESSLSYLGIIQLNTSNVTSVGTLLANGQGYLSTFPHIIMFPAIFIALLMITFNLFGNGLRDAFNPSLRGTED